jgi:hypothetical protein
LDTAVAVMGPRAGLELVAKTPGVAALIVRPTDREPEVFESPTFKKFVVPPPQPWPARTAPRGHDPASLAQAPQVRGAALQQAAAGDRGRSVDRLTDRISGQLVLRRRPGPNHHRHAGLIGEIDAPLGRDG